MIISVKRLGGFAGVTEDLITINTAQLNTALAQQVEARLRDLDFFNLSGAPSGGIGADFFRFEITATDGEREHTVTFYDDDSPENVPFRRLLDFLTQIGRV